jgi:hypothetical protein
MITGRTGVLVLTVCVLTATVGAAEKLAPLKIELPESVSKGTPPDIKMTPYREAPKPLEYKRPAFLAPQGTRVLSRGKPVTSSDDAPIIGELEMITDGDKDGREGHYVEIGPMRQWVQVDLGEVHTLYAILLWHYHGEGRIYHDVVVQIADDAKFETNVRTLYNNDYDNSSGLGIGKDKEYFEDFRGRLIPVKGLKARYVRFYSRGSTAGDLNHYTEVEVWGK